MTNAPITYKPGTIFRFTWTIDTDAVERQEKDVICILFQVKPNKFLFFDQINGNRWTKKFLKGNNEVVDQITLAKYLAETNVFDFEVLGQLSHLDLETVSYR